MALWEATGNSELLGETARLLFQNWAPSTKDAGPTRGQGPAKIYIRYESGNSRIGAAILNPRRLTPLQYIYIILLLLLVAAGLPDLTPSVSPMDPGSGSSLLSALPVEVIEFIFCQLHPLDVVRCRQICRFLCQVIDSSIELLLRMELVADGNLLKSRGVKPASILLQQVRERRRAFDELDPTWFWEIHRFPSDVTRYEINSGFLGHGINSTSSEHFRGVRYRRLLPPSLQRPDHVWEDVGFTMADLSFDFSEDLQVLVEQTVDRKQRRLRFKTISTNAPHPSARNPTVLLQEIDFAFWDSCSTLLYGDYLAIGFSQWDRSNTYIEGCQMVINWKTGELSLPSMETLDLAFLSESLILLIFEANPLCLGLYNLRKQTTIKRFTLPFSQPLASAFFLTHPPYKPDPFVSSIVSEKLVSDTALDIIGMLLTPSWSGGQDIYIVLSGRKFLRRALILCEIFPDKNCFNWEEWGPDVTRWFPPQMIQDVGFRGVFGSRMIAKGNLAARSASGTEDTLVLFDFNPRPITRGSYGDVGSDFTRIVVEEEWSWSDALDPSGMAVKSRLPFRAITPNKPLKYHYEDIYLDLNTIVGRTMDSYHLFSFLPRPEGEAPKESRFL
ncbi:hypothetical protein FRC19_007189 [Serendipita sp. 401]|nr:hypothetical protein FRC19_007189 [Serendipita sp. 401]